MSPNDDKIKRILEGALMVAGDPLTLDNLAKLFDQTERPSNKELRNVLKTLTDDYTGRGIELKQVASGYRFQVCADLGEWIGRLWEERPPRYSRALLETLSLIAYKQPITRGEIEDVRGVAVSTQIMRTLLEREWVRGVGHKDVPGKPTLYATTNRAGTNLSKRFMI
jgi:segregation and condensation protein B